MVGGGGPARTCLLPTLSMYLEQRGQAVLGTSGGMKGHLGHCTVASWLRQAWQCPLSWSGCLTGRSPRGSSSHNLESKGPMGQLKPSFSQPKTRLRPRPCSSDVAAKGFQGASGSLFPLSLRMLELQGPERSTSPTPSFHTWGN